MDTKFLILDIKDRNDSKYKVNLSLIQCNNELKYKNMYIYTYKDINSNYNSITNTLKNIINESQCIILFEITKTLKLLNKHFKISINKSNKILLTVNYIIKNEFKYYPLTLFNIRSVYYYNLNRKINNINNIFVKLNVFYEILESIKYIDLNQYINNQIISYSKYKEIKLSKVKNINKNDYNKILKNNYNIQIKDDIIPYSNKIYDNYWKTNKIYKTNII